MIYDRLYDTSDAYNDLWNKKIHINDIKLNILDDFLSLVSWQWNSAHDITTWHAGPSSTGFCGQFQHGRHGRPDPGVYQWCTMCIFQKKVIQFFPKHISLMVEFEKTPSSFWGSRLGGKCQVEKVSV